VAWRSASSFKIRSSASSTLCFVMTGAPGLAWMLKITLDFAHLDFIGQKNKWASYNSALRLSVPDCRERGFCVERCACSQRAVKS